jgi:NADP-dependent 3-hydroxy acid dehydrogenase YdfG
LQPSRPALALLATDVMSTATTVTPIRREPELLGQTVVVIGGSAGIGLETARRARAEGANLILTGRNAERLRDAGRDVGALNTAAFDATDSASLERFFSELPARSNPEARSCSWAAPADATPP